MKVHQSSILVFIYLILAIVFFAKIALPSIECNEKPIRISADMGSYIYVAKNIETHKLIELDGNFLGPILILKLLDYNYHLIFILNCLLFILSYKIIIINFDIKRNEFTILLLLSPILFISLFSLNKEILSLFATTVFISYLRNKSVTYLFFSLLLSILVRYQLTFVFFVTLFFIRNIRFFINRKYVIIIMLATISILFPIVRSYLSAFENSPKSSYGGGTVLIWNNLQNNFLYFVAFPLKLLQTFFGGIIGIKHLLSQNDFYNGVIIPLQSLIFLLITPILLFRKNNSNDDITFFVFIYLVIFLLTPFIQLRYFFCIYPVLCILIAQKKNILY